MVSNIYCIITTSLINENQEMRKMQYIRGITSLLNKSKDSNIKVIIVENNNLTSSFLDTFNVEVNYTDTNTLPTSNYGIKELHDIFNCIKKYNIQDEDYIIKFTGRYFLSEICPFFEEIYKLPMTKYEAILKYGWWGSNNRTKHEDCFSSLICMKAKYIKEIEIPTDTNTSAEWRWAKVTLAIPDSQVCALEKLGMYINPKCLNTSEYFEV